jgi:hypothetical protein
MKKIVVAKIPKELQHYADWVFIKTGIPQEETIKRVIEGCKIFIVRNEERSSTRRGDGSQLLGSH